MLQQPAPAVLYAGASAAPIGMADGVLARLVHLGDLGATLPGPPLERNGRHGKKRKGQARHCGDETGTLCRVIAG